MEPESAPEQELRRAALLASSRGESVAHILSEFLHRNFEDEQREADHAAAHRSGEQASEWWIASGATPPPGRHRAAS